jgi:hypothetical protein
MGAKMSRVNTEDFDNIYVSFALPGVEATDPYALAIGIEKITELFPGITFSEFILRTEEGKPTTFTANFYKPFKSFELDGGTKTVVQSVSQLN